MAVVEDERVGGNVAGRRADAPRGDAPERREREENAPARAREDGARGNEADRTEGDRRSDAEKRRDGRRGRRRSMLVRAVFGLVVVLLIAGGVWYYLSTENLLTTDDAYTDGRAVTIAPQVSGRVVALAVNDNQFVHAGEVLLRIDPRDYQAAVDQAKGALAIAKGQLASAEAGLAKARVTFPAQLDAAKAAVEVAQAQLFQAQTEYNRQHGLPRAATTQQAVDNSTAALKTAQAQLAQAQAREQEAEPVPQNIAQSEAQANQLRGEVQQAQAKLDQAELNLSYAVLKAPQDGWVTRRNVEMGNYLSAGTSVMTLVTPQIWVTANFKETQLTRLRPGQSVTINVDSYPGLQLTGHVDSVQLGSGSRFSAFPAENATGNYVKIVQRVPVKIDIDGGLDPNLPLPLGISVEPTVHLGDAKPPRTTAPRIGS